MTSQLASLLISYPQALCVCRILILVLGMLSSIGIRTKKHDNAEIQMYTVMTLNMLHFAPSYT